MNRDSEIETFAVAGRLQNLGDLLDGNQVLVVDLAFHVVELCNVSLIWLAVAQQAHAALVELLEHFEGLVFPALLNEPTGRVG